MTSSLWFILNHNTLHVLACYCPESCKQESLNRELYCLEHRGLAIGEGGKEIRRRGREGDKEEREGRR